MSSVSLTRAALHKAENYMRQAIQLARRAKGRTWPNPMVGCVVVNKGQIVGQGYHHKAGGPHAEVHALNQAGDRAQGADLYVTLEPCHVFGRTPPCTDLVIRSGVKRVFAGVCDPNPRECGAGLALLREAGIEAYEGILESECNFLNRVYNVLIQHARPFVTVNAACSLDGRLAPYTKDSRWISSKESRIRAHRLRVLNQALMVGAGTMRMDDPALNVRHVKGPDPIVVVLDTKLTTPVDAHLVTLKRNAPVWIYCHKTASATKAKQLVQAGVEIIRVDSDQGRLRLRAVLANLLERGVYRLLAEGGARVLGSLLQERMIDHMELHLAGCFLGSGGVPLFEWQGPQRVQQAPRLDAMRMRKVGADVHLSGDVVWPA